MEELEIDDPLTLFKDALSNPVTRDRYEKRLDQFFKYLALEGKTLQNRSENFTNKSKKNPPVVSYLSKITQLPLS